jgi:hypothetical protein
MPEGKTNPFVPAIFFWSKVYVIQGTAPITIEKEK